MSTHDKLCDYDWNIDVAKGTRTFENIYNYSHDNIGTFHVTDKVLDDYFMVLDDYSLLSIIYETKIEERILLICTDEGKKGFNIPGYDVISITELFNNYPDTLFEKQERILMLLYKIDGSIGAEIDFPSFKPYMFYAETESEMVYLIELLGKKNYIKYVDILKFQDRSEITGPLRIEEDGWLFIGEKLKNENSNKAFVAMWFHSKMDEACAEIEKAISSIGFKPIHIGKKEHNNDITGEILFEIRQCRFLLAEVTQQRQGVYFEAGYAMGKGIPVIWCCREDDLKNVHFDTRQYNHIVWKDETELVEKIKNRIKGTILI